TFAVSRNAKVRIDVHAAVYASAVQPADGSDGEKALRGFKRRQLRASPVFVTKQNAGDTSHVIFSEFDGSLASLRVRWRTLGESHVVTASIVNTRTIALDERPSPHDCLFQVGMDVRCDSGEFVEPPGPDVAFDAEERSLRLRYRRKVQWATGHASSVSWSQGVCDAAPERLSLDFTPVSDTHPFSPGLRPEASFDSSVLSIKRLSMVSSRTELRTLLEPFVADFESWLEGQSAQSVPSEHEQARDEVLADLNLQKERLRHGVEVLCSADQKHVFESFRLANHAMLLQMERGAIRSGRPFNSDLPTWRPFQLAFQLLSIPGSISDEEASGCDLVDLIWFPTGGGKTEAYLLLAAFVIIHRRFEHGVRGEGTCVLSRYTLRLLTNQQFDRTATL
ncbi:MAG: hypothetical protein VXY70_09100, partial [Actinomycetota bacterium]|nr:hypothetical protein [Actinomycetota bacterium]